MRMLILIIELDVSVAWQDQVTIMPLAPVGWINTVLLVVSYPFVEHILAVPKVMLDVLLRI
jgi:hypothetical protein